MMSVDRKIIEIPTSIEAIRRRVINVIQSVEKDTDTFLLRYLTNVGDPGRWTHAISLVCEQVGKSPDKLEDFKDLYQVLKKYSSLRDAINYPEITDLRRMVERGKMFDYITFSLRNDLVSTFDKQLKKYCLSFKPEADGKDLQSVKDYEKRIVEWRSQVKKRMQLVDNILDEYEDYKSPLAHYISHYHKVISLMEDTCQEMMNVCEPMKRWAISDSTYPRRLQEEVNIYNKRKMEMRDVVKQMEYGRDEVGRKLQKRALFAIKLEKLIHEQQDDKRFYRRRELEVQDNMDKVQTETERKKHDLDDVKDKFKNRKSNSPSIFNYLSSLVETLREDIWKLESKSETMQKQKDNLKDKQQEVQNEIDRLNKELNHSNSIRDRIMEKLQKEEYQIKLINDDLKQIDEKLIALKKIREIKLHTETVKKIYHFGYQPGKFSNRNELEKAFKITADDVGKDWIWLYRSLPFKPARDSTVRDLDIELIDKNLRRAPDNMTGNSTLAYKSLEKWKRLNKAASLDELLSTLKKLKRNNTIKKIQKEMHVASAS